MVFHEDLIDRIRIVRSGQCPGLRRDAQAHQARRHGARPIGLSAPPTIDGTPVGGRGHAVFTPLFNHARQPAISIPCGVSSEGLPIGLQIVAPRYEDARLLEIAADVEAILAR